MSEKHPNEKRFEDFFVEDKYVALKNHLYNYRVRQMAINKALAKEDVEMMLEVGSGLSPIVTGKDNIIYSELSYRALSTSKRLNRAQGHYVVADGTKLPFKDNGISHVICSEVLEHVEDDEKAIQELARVTKQDGLACITVPHRMFYYAADDRFVSHFRRYETDEMQAKLDSAGLDVKAMVKVLGPLEKITMYSVVMAFSMIQKITGRREAKKKPSMFMGLIAPIFNGCNIIFAGLARFDAWIMPHSLSTVVLFEARKPKSV